MPKTAVFTGFTTTGGGTLNSSQFNVSGVFDNGWNFLTGLPSGNTIYFTSLGYRDTDNTATGEVNGHGKEGNYWVSGASSASQGLSLGFNPISVYPLVIVNQRSFGFLIMSVVE